MSMRLKLTIGRKIYAIVALSFVGLLGITLFEMRDLQVGLEQQKTTELKHLTEIALGIAKEEHESAKKGAVTDEEARKRAAARIGALRYGRNDYFWINDMHPRMVMHRSDPEQGPERQATVRGFRRDGEAPGRRHRVIRMA